MQQWYKKNQQNMELGVEYCPYNENLPEKYVLQES